MVKVILVFLWIYASVSVGDPISKRARTPKELELKILEKLFTDLTSSREVRVMVLGEKTPYYISLFAGGSEVLRPVGSCEEADLLFLAGGYEGDIPRRCRGKVVFSSRKKHIFLWEDVVGAFFWKKGRPNLLLIKERLEEKSIKLPREYEKFIEPLEGAVVPRRVT